MKKLPGRPTGLPKTGGRKKGTPNRRTLDLVETLTSKGYDPAAELIWVYEQAKQEYQRHDELAEAIADAAANEGEITLDQLRAFMNRNDKPAYLALAANAAKELMQYVYPKRKAIEVSKANPFEGLSQPEMLAKARELVKFLEEGESK